MPDMTNLVQDVRKEFPEFWELPISICNTDYGKTEFDRINVSLILEHLIGSTDNFLLIVNPVDPTIAPISFIEGLLSLLKRDLLAEDPEVLSGIKIGDTVALINGRTTVPGIYLGIEKGSDGITRHIVREDVKSDSPVTHGIPLRFQWTIQPYSQAVTIKNKRQAEISGERLEKILNLPPGGLLAFQKSKMLFVTKNKTQLKEEISDTYLGGDPLTAVFPVADYISGREFVPIGSNPLRREPTGGLVSNLDQAVDIALENDSIKLIIVDGAAKLRSHFGSLEKLRNDSDSCRVICLLNAEDEDQITTLKNLGAQAWIWKRSDFKGMKSDNLSVDNGSLVSMHNLILNYIGGSDPEVLTVSQSQELAEAIDSSFRLITQINSKTRDDPECAVLLRWSISLVNGMMQLPITIDDYHNYIGTLNEGSDLRLDEKISSLEQKVRSSYGFSVPLEVKDEWEQLLENIQLIYMLIKQENPKWKALLDLTGTNGTKKGFSLLIPDGNYCNAVTNLFPGKFGNVLTGSETGNTAEETVVVTGWKNKQIAAKLFLSPYKKCIYLLYPQENQRYGRVLQTHPASPESDADSFLRKAQGFHSENETTYSDTDMGRMLDDIEQKLSDSLYRVHLQEFGEENMTEVRRILFEENQYSYVSENQALNKLNRDNKTIEKCQLKDIIPGDELVFAESQRDMFEELLAILRQSDQYKLLFSDTQQWHAALVSYMKENFIDESNLSSKLSSAGCRVGIGTLKSWVNGDLISPSESNLRVLAKVIDDSELNHNLDQIIISARKVHALHIQTGRLLVRRIINAVVQDEDDEIDEETRKKIEDYSRKAKIVTVREILPDALSVPAKAIGRLFEF